jgi:GT2 family glycosyltransferase
VALVQIEVDAPPSPDFDHLNPGERVWVEVLKQHQVVGVVEAVACNDNLPPLLREELARSFADVTPEPRKRLADADLPKATVVVPTICQNPAELVRTVESLVSMDYPDFEIILVDNRSGPDRVPLPTFSDPRRVRVVIEPRHGISAARNRGSASAAGDIVAFTDDDTVAKQNWLRVIGTRFAQDPKLDAIGGLVLPMELDTEPQLWFEEFYGGFTRSFRAETFSIERLHGTDGLFPYAAARFGTGCNMAFRRSTLQKMGGFDTSLGTGTPAKGGEDLAMFIELITSGGTLAFEPAALILHSHRRTEREFLQEVFSYGTGLTAMYTAISSRHPRHLIELIRRVPAGIRLLIRPRGERSPSRAPGYPRRTLVYQLVGMAYGPLAYARSVIRNRRTR